MKWFIYIFFIILFLLVTFFGLGPVLMADGSTSERMLTLAIVLLAYILLTVALRFLVKKFDK